MYLVSFFLFFSLMIFLLFSRCLCWSHVIELVVVSSLIIHLVARLIWEHLGKSNFHPSLSFIYFNCLAFSFSECLHCLQSTVANFLYPLCLVNYCQFIFHCSSFYLISLFLVWQVDYTIVLLKEQMATILFID